MSIIPILKAKDLLRLLLKLGFKIISQKGSYVKLQHFLDKTRQVILPVHSGDLKRGTLLSILKQAKIPIREFLIILGKIKD